MPPVRVRPKIDPTTKNRLATDAEVQLAARGLQDLSNNRLRIGFVPAPVQNFDGHKIRVIESSNPKWYQDFVHGHWNRKGCQIKRGRVVKALTRVFEKGIVRSNGYDARLLAHIANYPVRPEW